MADNTTKAVFLSYAREDLESARRIADALRAFGVETWIDQSELRGGDAWDQQIRRQIKECALFVPPRFSVNDLKGRLITLQEQRQLDYGWEFADERMAVGWRLGAGGAERSAG